jgi:phospholipase C
MAGLTIKIDHIVVLMLENRSFDCLLGRLNPAGPNFRGLTGSEFNIYTAPNGSTTPIPSRSDWSLDTGLMTVPNPDPGEHFDQMNMQLFGLGGLPDVTPLPPPPMSGFVDNYMRQPPADATYYPAAPMHYYLPEQVPVISLLARSFAVSDQWHASVPCQTWPNRFFVHRATAGGYVNNTVEAIASLSPSIFHRLETIGRTSRIYFHDVPQSITLADQWPVAAQRFRPIECFWDDADHGDLADYSFIEPRYFTDSVLGLMPNDQHPPHDVVYGEQLMAQVYNAVRASPAWKRTLLVITFDEHGGCYDHVPPPAAPPPDAGAADPFNRYGVRVPAIVISPYIRPETVLRNLPDPGSLPFDHTSIIRTVRQRFDPDGTALTGRDQAAPSLDLALNLDEPANDGPDQIDVPSYTPSQTELQSAKDMPPNDLQRSLCELSMILPKAANGAPNIQGMQAQLAQNAGFLHTRVADAESLVRENLKSFLGSQ